MIYATTEPQTLQRIQAQYGDKASSERVEQLFGGVSGNPRKFRHSALWNFLGGWSAA
ncbi:hypothetical protein AE87_05530 [Klebsiella pneumoniae CHS 31]|nr:hypothetical protein AE87_05530 [Klebsiella pneumoniae CHS 31]